MNNLTTDNVIQCWCGAVGTSEELFEFGSLPSRCGGSGHLDCACAGDGCFCHLHGGCECPGCPDCLGDPDDLYDDDWTENYPLDSPDEQERRIEIIEQERSMWAEYESEHGSAGKGIY